MKICPICKSKKIISSSFGKSPVSGYVCKNIKDSFKQKKYKVTINFCKKCGILFRQKVSWAKKLVDKIYKTHEATNRASKSYKKHYKYFCQQILRLVSSTKRPKILEIGCNDGSLLKLIKKSNPQCLLYGYEPSKIAKKWNKTNNYVLINSFLNMRTAKKFVKKYGHVDVVFARHVLEHIEEPHEFIRALTHLCKSSGSIVIESPYVLSILRCLRYENISYTHAIHYSLKAIQRLFSKQSFNITFFKTVKADGGSAIYILCKKDKLPVKIKNLFKSESQSKKYFINFKKGFEKKRELLIRLLDKYRKHLEIIGFGAGAKGIFLIHILKIQKVLSRVIDNTKNYENKYIPATDLAITPLTNNVLNKKVCILNLAPTHIDLVRKKCIQAGAFLDPIKYFGNK